MTPPDTDLTDDRSVRRLLRTALPPLRGDAAALLVPACDGRSDTGVLCLVDDLPETATVEEARLCVHVFASVACMAPRAPGLLVAVQRRGEAGLREADVLWVQAARDACGALGVALLGVWLAVERQTPMRLDAPLPVTAETAA